MLTAQEREWVLIADNPGQDGSAQVMRWAQELNNATKYLPQWVIYCIPVDQLPRRVLRALMGGGPKHPSVFSGEADVIAGVFFA